MVSEGSVDIYNPKVVRSTMGSIFRIPIYHTWDKIGTIKELKIEDLKFLLLHWKVRIIFII